MGARRNDLGLRPPRASPQKAAVYAQRNQARFVAELQQFVKFPSISALPRHATDVRRCAMWLADHLRRLGLPEVRVIETRRHPLVFGRSRFVEGSPTVLVYGHYDVQPVDPVEEWRTPPFEPSVRSGYLHGRGASDDKGQLFAHVKALEAYLRTDQRTPVNVKYLFEGEEEAGSPNLVEFLRTGQRALRADAVIVSDMPIPRPDQPAITYSMRGGLSLEVEVTGPRRDLHSGIFGGAVHNPLQALCELIGRLHDGCGRVTIPGFYDEVRQWSDAERLYLAEKGPADREMIEQAQVRAGWGDPGFSLYERTTTRPALTINGIIGGYRGPGTKAVIPSRASAKVSFRLVPDQDAAEVERNVRDFIARFTPPTVRVAVRTQFSAEPVLIDRGEPAIRAAMSAYRAGFGVEPVFTRLGGTIPVIGTLQRIFDVPIVLMGFALRDDGMHGPNERFYLPNFFNGITSSIWLLANLAQVMSEGVRRRPRSRRSG
jgi:acetylornithine deacetylase/succinyl-diaminopimelate desuccinylase-like protein